MICNGNGTRSIHCASGITETIRKIIIAIAGKTTTDPRKLTVDRQALRVAQRTG